MPRDAAAFPWVPPARVVSSVVRETAVRLNVYRARARQTQWESLYSLALRFGSRASYTGTLVPMRIAAYGRYIRPHWQG
jgi:hypothetical protein